MQAIVMETASRRRDSFPSVFVRRFGDSGNRDHLGDRASSDIKFCNLFRQDMEGLYLLAFLLTANPETAEQCFISSLEECIECIAVHDQWASSWAKRVVIKNAIRLVAPRAHDSSSKALPCFRQMEYEPQEQCRDNRALISVQALGDFARFAFVMTVLEQLTDRDSALLLGCLPDKIRVARVRALVEVASWRRAAK
jgi:hypothetical protein